MYIIGSICSKNSFINEKINEKRNWCSFQNTALLVDALIAATLLAGGILSILSQHQVNLGPVNTICSSTASYSNIMLGSGVTLLIVDGVLFSIIKKNNRIQNTNLQTIQYLRETEIVFQQKIQELTIENNKYEKLINEAVQTAENGQEIETY